MIENKSYAEELAAYILKRCFTVGALRAYQEKKGLTIEEAISTIEGEMIEMIDAHTDRESWLSFAELPEPQKVSEEIISRIYKIACEGWRRGYIAGFQDRSSLG